MNHVQKFSLPSHSDFIYCIIVPLTEKRDLEKKMCVFLILCACCEHHLGSHTARWRTDTSAAGQHSWHSQKQPCTCPPDTFACLWMDSASHAPVNDPICHGGDIKRIKSSQLFSQTDPKCSAMRAHGGLNVGQAQAACKESRMPQAQLLKPAGIQSTPRGTLGSLGMAWASHWDCPFKAPPVGKPWVLQLPNQAVVNPALYWTAPGGSYTSFVLLVYAHTRPELRASSPKQTKVNYSIYSSKEHMQWEHMPTKVRKSATSPCSLQPFGVFFRFTYEPLLAFFVAPTLKWHMPFNPANKDSQRCDIT